MCHCVCVNETVKGGDWHRTWRLERWNMTNLAVVHSKSFSEFSINQSRAHGGRLIYGERSPCLPGKVGLLFRYRTWHRACVRGLIERQRPMRKGKKIKRGRKGKHLGVLDILSALNTHPGHGKTPWMGFAIQLKHELEAHFGLWMGAEIKWWTDKSLETIPRSPCVWEPNMQRHIWVPFCSWKCSSDVLTQEREKEGGSGGRQNKQQLR